MITDLQLFISQTPSLISIYLKKKVGTSKFIDVRNRCSISTMLILLCHTCMGFIILMIKKVFRVQTYFIMLLKPHQA